MYIRLRRKFIVYTLSFSRMCLDGYLNDPVTIESEAFSRQAFRSIIVNHSVNHLYNSKAYKYYTNRHVVDIKYDIDSLNGTLIQIEYTFLCMMQLHLNPW